MVCGEHTFISPVCTSCKKKYFSADIKTVAANLCSQSCNTTVIQSLDRMYSLFPYRLWNKELMFTWKTKEVRSLSLFFAGILNSFMRIAGIEIIVPVPPRKGKIKEKGWDQIDELCNLLEYVYDYKILRVLERLSSGEQKKLDREGRLEQIGKSYRCISAATLPEAVCLLDDVCTTGSTMETCARCLKNAGIKEVTGITLFIVD